MRITITNNQDQIWSQEVDGNLDLGTIKMLSALDLGMDPMSMTLVINGRPVIQNESTLDQSGVQDGDIIMALPVNAQQLLQQQQQQQQQSRSRSRGPPNFQQQVQQLMADPSQRAIFRERWPSLAQALDSGDTNKAAKLLEDHWKTKQEEDERLRRAEANPEDPENQKYLEERIRQQNVDQSLMEAQENFPEMFGTVVMLYIECKVNGHDVKAFVDSGAQMTIMSQACAQRCNIMRLLDKRFAGIAKGVGTQKILGRIHTGQIQIKESFIPQSFSVMEDQPMELLIGLDMLKRHQCVLDLRANSLTIGTTGTTVQFLSEGQLDASARLAGPAAEAAQREEMEIQEALEASKSDQNQPSSSSSKQPEAQINPKVTQVMNMTKCTKQKAEEALAKFNNDPNAAALSLLTSGL